MKHLAFSLLGCIILTLIVATVVEKIYGSNIYQSYWFILLWAVFAGVSFAYILRQKLFRKKAVFLIHLSFLFILTGALTTYLHGKQGLLHLRQQETVASFICNDSQQVAALPFSVTLEKFDIMYYPGTPSPMDYVSVITLSDNGNVQKQGEVAMNRILKHKGYRFYQSGYDDDGLGTTLAVSYDPWGIGITYAGYALLLLSILLFFFAPGTGYKALFASLRKGVALVALLLLCATNIYAAPTTEKPKALPKETATAFGDLYVLYNGRICPLQTVAKEITTKLYGRPTYRGLTAEQVFTGWMYYYSSWRSQPTKKLKSQAEANEREYLIQSLLSGTLLKIFPLPGDDGTGVISWYTQNDNLPDNIEGDEWIFIKKTQNYIHEMVVKKDYKGIAATLQKIKEYQRKNASHILPSDTRFRAEKLYNALYYTKPLAMLCLTVGILSFLYSCICMAIGRRVKPFISWSLLILLFVVFAYLTLHIVLRWITSGYLPLSNGYETMQFMAWCSLLFGFLMRGKGLFLPFGFLLCGLTLLVSMMGEANPQITQLMPVLSSPLLSIHVVIIMLAYSLFAFMMLNGMAAYIIKYVGKPSWKSQVGQLHIVSRLLLYPALFCLVIGIFVGAVWANISWGRYWGWDPKEVWALITMLIYSLAIHAGSLSWFRRPMFFHLFAIFAFLSVVITYFGVNFFLGGMHSYA